MARFFHYEIRHTTPADATLAADWSAAQLQTREFSEIANAVSFWMEQRLGPPRKESFIVFEEREEVSLASHPAMSKQVYVNHYPLAFVKTEHVTPIQVRIHFQASPTVSRLKLLKAVYKLVPLIEKGLALRGVRLIFFTSHSEAMAAFMTKHLKYRYYGDAGTDGMIMAKRMASTVAFTTNPSQPVGR
jgi:hypothetical protein